MRWRISRLVSFGVVLASVSSALQPGYAARRFEISNLASDGKVEHSVLGLQSRSLNQTELDNLGQCAGQCLDEVVPRYGCNFDDECFCKNGNITASIEACLDSNCTTADGLAAQRFQADTCNAPVRDRGGLSRNLCWAMFTIATLFVLGRFVSRMPQLGGSGYSWDDWTVLFCYALLVPTDVSCEFEVRNGLGRDMYMLSLDQIVTILRWFYFGELFYNIIVMATKISLILLYLRIWTADSASSTFRVTCWTLIGILTATATAGVFGIIFQCTPISYAWEGITGTTPGHCIALEPFTYAYGALNISYDVVVFFLPIHSLLKLRVPWPKKFGLCAVFLVGFLVTICSIIRLQYLVRLSETKNISWNFQYIGMWSLVEANFSIVCCCMPAMAGLVQRIWFKSNFSSMDESRSKQTGFSGGNQGVSACSSPRSGSDPTYIETALEKGHQNDSEQHEDRLGGRDMTQHDEDAHTAVEILNRDRENDRPTSAILYRQRADGDRQSYYVEIAHEPPTEASTTKLSYRDHNNVLHEVEIIDRPQVQVGNRNLRAERASQMLRLETFGFGERTTRIPSTGHGSGGGGGYSTNTTPSIMSPPLTSPSTPTGSSSGSTPRRTSRVGVTLFGGP